jgi:hypothetical protein
MEFQTIEQVETNPDFGGREGANESVKRAGANGVGGV